MAKNECRFKEVVAHCDNRLSTRINVEKGAKKFTVTNVPHEVMREVKGLEIPGVRFLPDDSKIILFGNSASNIQIPTGIIHGKHTVSVVRKKCGAVFVERYNSDVMLSSPCRARKDAPQQRISA